jgi:hypothetical protein
MVTETGGFATGAGDCAESRSEGEAQTAKLQNAELSA